jgi:hypothetical protein
MKFSGISSTLINVWINIWWVIFGIVLMFFVSFPVLFIGLFLHRWFGWGGVAIGGPIIPGIVVVYILKMKYEKRKERYRRRIAPCSHGTEGALYGFKECIQCKHERIVREQLAKREAEEAEARKRAAKEQEYREWVAKIRLPEYLLNMHPEEFEHLVCVLFERMGFEVEHTRYSGDEGIAVT